MTTIQTSSTLAALVTRISEALKVAYDDLGKLHSSTRGPDVYSIVAPIVIEGYAEIDKAELGYVPGGEFGLCGGRVDSTPATSVEDTVAMFMQIVKDFNWHTPNSRNHIHVEGADLKYRCWKLGITLSFAGNDGYPRNTWRVSCHGRGSDVLHAFEDVNDPRVLYVIGELEKTGLRFESTTALDYVASHMIATYNASTHELAQHQRYVATAQTKRGH